MTVAQRRLLYSSFILFFVVVCPIVLLYGTGYRFDLRHRRVFRIGLLALDVTPEPETLLIDGRVRQFSSGATIRADGLAPGQHHVRLEKRAYLPWEQDVIIEPGRATNIQDIQLFHLGMSLVVSRDVENAFPAPDGRMLALLHAAPPTLTVASTGEQPEEMRITDEALTTVRWSPDSKTLLVIAKNGAGSIHRLAVKEEEPLPEPDVAVTDAAWHPKDANILYLLRKTVLLRWDRAGRTAVPLASRVQAFLPGEHDVVLVQATGNEQHLVVVRRDGSTSILKRLPAAASWQLLPGPAETVTLLDREHGQLLIIHRTSPDVAHVYPNVQQAAWSANGRAIFLQNSFELSRVDRMNTEHPEGAELLLRSGTPIIAVSPLGGSARFLLLQQSNGLRLLDTAQGASRQPYMLFPGVLHAFTQTGSLLYLITEKRLLVRLQL